MLFSNHKLYLFSAHDATLITLCAALDIELKEWPPFASYVSLELYENEVMNDENKNTRQRDELK